MITVTALYGQPTDAAAFEEYYFGTHLPIAARIPHVHHVDTALALPGPDGEAPKYYRSATIWFASQADVEAGMGSPEAEATLADCANYATGGVEFITQMVD